MIACCCWIVWAFWARMMLACCDIWLHFGVPAPGQEWTGYCEEKRQCSDVARLRQCARAAQMRALPRLRGPPLALRATQPPLVAQPVAQHQRLGTYRRPVRVVLHGLAGHARGRLLADEAVLLRKLRVA